MQEHNNEQASLAAHLISEGLAEERRGYGHATGQEVAEAVFAWLGQRESALLARLSDPDPALVEAVANALHADACPDDDCMGFDGSDYEREARLALAAVAAHLTDPTPTEDGDRHA